MDKDAEIRRGHEAERIVASPIWQEAFDLYQQRLLNAWENTGVGKADDRERIWQAYQITKKVRVHLESIITTGRMAQRQVEELHGRKSTEH